jgi:hypothetical protein
LVCLGGISWRCRAGQRESIEGRDCSRRRRVTGTPAWILPAPQSCPSSSSSSPSGPHAGRLKAPGYRSLSHFLYTHPFEG